MTQIITIDGHSASGKGTLAKRLAEHLNYFYLDTGKIYRLIGTQAHELNFNPEEDKAAIITLARQLAKNFNLKDLENDVLKSDMAGQMGSRVAVVPELRAAIIDLQRYLADNPPEGRIGSVLDGRDCGTVLCPHANHKFFVTANAEVRAKRRFDELRKNGDNIDFQTVLNDMKIRDHRDENRDIAPLKPAESAIMIDTSDMNADQAIEEVLKHL
jgi:cytidylate kinase